MNWYTGKVSGGQGIVIEEGTGRNVAVAYDEKDTPLLAAAPELLKALKGTMRTMQMMHGADCRCVECKDARAAIEKAEETE